VRFLRAFKQGVRSPVTGLRGDRVGCEPECAGVGHAVVGGLLGDSAQIRTRIRRSRSVHGSSGLQELRQLLVGTVLRDPGFGAESVGAPRERGIVIDTDDDHPDGRRGGPGPGEHVLAVAEEAIIHDEDLGTMAAHRFRDVDHRRRDADQHDSGNGMQQRRQGMAGGTFAIGQENAHP